MSRKRSNSSRNGPSPYTSTDGIIPPPRINSYELDDDEPFSNYTINKPHKMRRTGSGRHPLHVPDLTIYEDPKDFFGKSENALSPAVPIHQHPRRNSRRLSSSPGQAAIFSQYSPLSQSPATPTSDGLTHATTYTSGNMSRQSSHAGSSFVGGFDMLKLNSHISDVNSNLSTSLQESPLDLSQSLATTKDYSPSQFEAEFSFLVGHAGGMHGDTLHTQSSSVPEISSSLQSAIDAEAAVMKRSSSTETNGSSQSRVTRRSQEQLAQSSRPIAPKLGNATLMSREPSASSTASSDHQMVRIRSADGSMKDVVPIAKAPYVRPTHEKVKCTQCDEHPDGFRGEHELRRHTDRAHSVVRKAYVCIDISPDQKFLASCKACRNNKKYNAYYNAAAHLRRTHFNPKEKGRKGKGSIKPEEKRGGKGGGHDPSMEKLKAWMKEIEDRVPQTMPPYEDGEDEEDNTVEYAYPQPIHGDPFGQHSFAPSTPSLNILDANANAYTPPMFAMSAPARQSPYSVPLHLARPQHAVAANDPDMVDFSQNTISSDLSSSVPPDFEDVFNMSPLFEDPQYYDGLDGSGFPGLS